MVLGGSGFLGSHLCDQLLVRGDEVVCVDNFSTGRKANVAHLADHPGFELVEADISVGIPVDGAVTGVCNLASPASPPDYLALPLETLAVGSEGTRHGLELAGRHGARFLMASSQRCMTVLANSTGSKDSPLTVTVMGVPEKSKVPSWRFSRA